MSVKCELCGKEFTVITSSHTKLCGRITISEYRNIFPNSKITSEEIIDLKRINAVNQWSNEEQKEKKIINIRNATKTEKFSNLMKKSWNDERKIKATNITSKSWKDPKIREARTIGIRKSCNTDESKKNRKNGQLERFYGKNGESERKRQSEILKRVWRDPNNKSKRLNSLREFWKNNPSVKELISKKISALIIKGKHRINNQYKSGHFFSNKNNKKIHYRSSYENRYYKYLENNSQVISYNTEAFSIQYIDLEGLKKNYIPDVLVKYQNKTKELVEIKPKCFLKDKMVILKLQALKNYCEENNLIAKIITEKELDNLK